MKCLGLDVGSSTIKGAVLDLERNQIGATAKQPFPPPVSGLPSGWFEVSPAKIEVQVGLVLEELLNAAPDASSLYWAGQMGGVILVDASGAALTNYLSWRDQRTLGRYSSNLSYLDAIAQRWGDVQRQSLGNELQPGSTPSLLFWLARHDALPAQAIPVSVADFAIGRLCQSPPRMHVTHAMGMLDLRESEWPEAALAALELGVLRLPELSRGVEPVGRFSARGRSLLVFGAYGDQQCALRGAGLRQDELSINVSTGSQVSCRVSRFEPGNYQTRAYFDGDWLNTVTHLPAGRSLNVLVDLLTELAVAEGVELHDPWGHIVRKSAEMRATDLQVDLNFFSGPLGAAGHIGGVTTENLTVGNLFYAAMRAMADNYARCAEWLDPGRSWKSVVLSGGLTQAIPLLRHMLQDRFDVPLRDSVGEETLRGLLDIALTNRNSQ